MAHDRVDIVIVNKDHVHIIPEQFKKHFFRYNILGIECLGAQVQIDEDYNAFKDDPEDWEEDIEDVMEAWQQFKNDITEIPNASHEFNIVTD